MIRGFILRHPALQPGQHVLDVLVRRGVRFEVVPDLADAVRRADVLYVTRIQAERFDNPAEAARLTGLYIVDRELIERVGRADSLTILHPLPRYGDLSPDVDALPGAAYFRQAHYGVPVRMALFCDVFGVEP